MRARSTSGSSEERVSSPGWRSTPGFRRCDPEAHGRGRRRLHRARDGRESDAPRIRRHRHRDGRSSSRPARPGVRATGRGLPRVARRPRRRRRRRRRVRAGGRRAHGVDTIGRLIPGRSRDTRPGRTTRHHPCEDGRARHWRPRRYSRRRAHAHERPRHLRSQRRGSRSETSSPANGALSRWPVREPAGPHRGRCDHGAPSLSRHPGHCGRRLFGAESRGPGANEKALDRAGDHDYEKIYLYPNSHAGTTRARSPPR